MKVLAGLFLCKPEADAVSVTIVKLRHHNSVI